MKTQMQHFYASQFEHSAGLHERMAEMQAKAGLHRLAQESKHTAIARRISAANADLGPEMALSYGEWAANTLKANA